VDALEALVLVELEHVELPHLLERRFRQRLRTPRLVGDVLVRRRLAGDREIAARLGLRRERPDAGDQAPELLVGEPADLRVRAELDVDHEPIERPARHSRTSIA
jgi:hypothetical protein